MRLETLRMLYYALFHSIISYEIIAWGVVYSNFRNLLQSHQKRKRKNDNKKDFTVNRNSLKISQSL